MANYSRTDNSPSIGQPRQKPIVLARLPRIGASVAAPTATRTSAAPPAPTPHSAPRTQVPPPQQLPRLELRGQIEERIKLHVAEPTEEPTRSSNVYFADRDHKLASEPKPQRIQQPTHPSSSGSHSRRRHDHSSPATVGEQLFQLHSNISPYAGLIVTLALIASAGLLYWLSVGPAQPGPGFDGFATEVPSEGLGYNSDHLPDNYVPQFTTEIPEHAATSESNDQWEAVALPAFAPASEPTQLPPLKQDSSGPQAGASTNSSLYPKSLASEPLDFTKVKSNATGTQQPLGGIHMSPSVARRGNTSTNR